MTDPLVRPKECKSDATFGTRNVRSQYRAHSITTVAKELERYKLDSVGVQEVRWDNGGTVGAEIIFFVYGKVNENHQLQTEFLYTTE